MATEPMPAAALPAIRASADSDHPIDALFLPCLALVDSGRCGRAWGRGRLRKGGGAKGQRQSQKRMACGERGFHEVLLM